MSSRLSARIKECRRLMIAACQRGDRPAHYGYMAESLGLADAATSRPCDPFQVSEQFQGRYTYGYKDGESLRKLEERACVST